MSYKYYIGFVGSFIYTAIGFLAFPSIFAVNTHISRYSYSGEFAFIQEMLDFIKMCVYDMIISAVVLPGMLLGITAGIMTFIAYKTSKDQRVEPTGCTIVSVFSLVLLGFATLCYIFAFVTIGGLFS